MFKKLLLIAVIILMSNVCFGANDLIDGRYHTTATVDTAPDAPGFATSEVIPSQTPDYVIIFSVRGTGSMTVTLQFKGTVYDTWEDEGTYSTGDCKQIKCISRAMRWRAIVKNGEYTSGSLIFGFEW